MNDPQWQLVDDFLTERLAPADAALKATLEANATAGLPAIDVSPLLGKLLHVLVKAVGARSILEIGTLGGYSTIWLARALPAGGKVTTLESDPDHAIVAKANLTRAGLYHLVDLRLAPAAETLAELKAQACPPFDFIFIDADKPSYPEYLTWCLQLSRPGTVIVADNVVRAGKIVDASSSEPDVQGIRRFLDMLAAEPRLSTSALQTVGKKGYDGVAIAVVLR